MKHHGSIDRRQLLRLGLGSAAALSFTSPLGLARLRLQGRRDPERGPCLVLVQLSGGNDGLNTVVPYRDDAYYEARPKLAHDKGDVLRLTDDLAFAPSLEGLHRLWGDGRLGVVPGIGYPEPNRSHFKSFEIWHTADLRGRAGATGWVGRLVSALHPGDADPHRMVHVGSRLPYSLHSPIQPALAFRAPRHYRWAGDGTPPPELTGADEPAEPEVCEHGRDDLSNLDFVRSVMHDAAGSSAAVRSAVAGYRPSVEYANQPLAQALATCAALLESGLATDVLSVEHDGYDTHSGQAIRHAQRLGQLDEALTAFLDDLEARGSRRQVFVLVFSEFGRRVQENASGGTDHGTAGPMLYAGNAARIGLAGEQPSLVRLDERGDLVHTTDFRSVYGTLIEDLFEADMEAVLGARFPTLPVVA